MDAERLAEIRARCEAATAGPWWHDWNMGGSPNEVWVSGDSWGLICTTDGGVGDEDKDAEFIAHAREDIPALLAEVERLRGENEANAEAVEGWALLHKIHPDAAVICYHLWRDRASETWWSIVSSTGGRERDYGRLIAALREVVA